MFDEAKADHAVNFINCLKHTKGRWRGVPFELLPWQDEIIRTPVSYTHLDVYKRQDGLYCEEHEALHRGDRASSNKRGYNRQWQKARARYLKAQMCIRDRAYAGEAETAYHHIPDKGCDT